MSDPASESRSDDASDQSDVAELERIEWEDRDSGSRLLTPERVALAVGLLVVAGVYAYYRAKGSIYLVWFWNVGPADWLTFVAAAVLVAYGAVPLASNRQRVRQIAGRFRRHRLTAVALAGLAGVMVVGLYGLAGFPAGGLTNLTLERFQPPVGTTVSRRITQADCVGYVPDGWDPGRPCHGTWQFPLGTDRWGYDMIDLLIAGARPVVYLTVVTAGVIVPLATVVGLVAGYYGGLVDDLLMAYVDAQLSVPAILLYLIAFMFIGNSMFVLLAAFGLLSWGGLARIVRSETLKHREEGYVLAARAVGTPRRSILKRHLLPNVTDTVVPATFHLVAILVLTEAGLSFLGFHASFQSWGMTVAEGLSNGPPRVVWWNSTFPAIALTLTVAGFKVAGDGLRDVLDPRGER